MMRLPAGILALVAICCLAAASEESFEEEGIIRVRPVHPIHPVHPVRPVHPVKDANPHKLKGEVYCPVRDSWEAVYIANPSDCHSFYLCSNGSPIKFMCPNDLVWNESLQVCDFGICDGNEGSG